MTGNILKKIRMLFIREKTIFSLIVICTFISSVILCFCFGLFCDYIEKKNREIYELTTIRIEFDYDIEHDRYVTKKQLEECILQFSDYITDSIEIFFVRSWIENDMLLECRFIVNEGEYLPCDVVRNNLTKTGELINYFTEDQEKNGDKVAIIPGKEWTWNDLSVIDQMMTDEKHIDIEGTEYRVIGYHGWGSRILIPFASMDNDSVIDAEGLTLGFKRSISFKQYNEIKRIIEQCLGDVAHVPEMPVLDTFRMTVYNTVLLIDILIAGWLAINFAILYSYILFRRRRDIGIFLMCGLSKSKVSAYVVLCFHLFVIPGFICGIIFYHYILLPVISWMIPNAIGNYNLLSYICLTIVFEIVSLIITGITIAAVIHGTDIVKALKTDSE
ncbi:MAG: hypothetical protein HFI47_14530 [Lachnospiraceae bacterium]|nr:hypothetical protein [Lachnospiraceae bacterium]